jgi:FkbM family methyltransferase
MINTSRPIAFVLASTNLGTLIINRNDVCRTANDAFGVGHQLFETSDYVRPELQLTDGILMKRRQHFGDGVVALDCGANIGTHSVEWGRLMHGWGSVVAFEAQERIFYALAGNIAINNCMNVIAHNLALGRECGQMGIPQPDYLSAASYGSLELKPSAMAQFIGQTIDYERTLPVNVITVDSLNLSRVDFIKLDVEGMEQDVLEGARATIDRCHPVLTVEVLKSDEPGIVAWLTHRGYRLLKFDINLLAIHESDPMLKEIAGE